MKKSSIIATSIIVILLTGCSGAPTVSPIIVESSEPSPAAANLLLS